jgi:hypothetical protein
MGVTLEIMKTDVKTRVLSSLRSATRDTGA